MNRSRFGILKYNTKKLKHKELKKAVKIRKEKGTEHEHEPKILMRSRKRDNITLSKEMGFLDLPL